MERLRLAASAASSDEELDDILTADEVADWLRFRPSTIYAWAASGKLPCVRLGGRIRFLRCDVLRWIEARKVG